MRQAPRVLVALITPFAGQGVLDEDAHRHNVSTLVDGGVEGFVLAGSTGQGPYLLAGERGSLVRAARDTIGADPFLACGIQAESVRQALVQIEDAASAGAEAALVMTPTTLVRGHDDRVALFYGAVADASALPVFMYSIPATTGYQLPIEVAADLAKHPNIVGLKDSGAEANRVVPLADAIAGGFVAMAGSSRVVNEFMLHGAHGAITASSNYAYELVVDALDNAYAQERLTRLSAAVERFGLAGTYAAAEAVGLQAGTMRLPLQPLAGAEQAAVTDLLG